MTRRLTAGSPSMIRMFYVLEGEAVPSRVATAFS